MEKIVIIGSSGAGKSKLARELSRVLKMKVYHLDRLFWQRNWERKTKDTRIDILQNLVREKRWIIDGAYLNTSVLHLEAADTIILLDTPPLWCLWRLMKRHREHYRHFRRDIPMECTDRLTLLHILKVLAFPLRSLKTLKQKLRNYKYKQIIRFRSAKEIKDFLAQLVQDMDDKKGSSFVAHVANEKSLVSTRR